ncbi:MAG: hypothetical protein ACFCU1_02685 [Sumerlaeia bacterium]
MAGHSARNGGEDIHEDVIGEAPSNEPLTLRSVELNFVPAAGWLRESISKEMDSITDSVVSLQEPRSRILKGTGLDSVRVVTVPVESQGSAPTSIIVYVYAQHGKPAQEFLIGSKEVYIPTPGYPLSIPVLPPDGTKALRVVAYAVSGNGVWRCNINGQPLVELEKYRVNEKHANQSSSNSEATTTVTLKKDAHASVEFTASEPFTAIHIPLRQDVNSLNAAGNRTSRLLLPSKRSFHQVDGVHPFYKIPLKLQIILPNRFFNMNPKVQAPTSWS